MNSVYWMDIRREKVILEIVVNLELSLNLLYLGIMSLVGPSWFRPNWILSKLGLNHYIKSKCNQMGFKGLIGPYWLDIGFLEN